MCACVALGVNQAWVYRVREWRGHLARAHIARGARQRPPLALSGVEQDALLEVLNSDRFADKAPASIHAMLLDESRYLASVRPLYRLLATRACEVWSWEITNLEGLGRLHPI